MYDENQILKVRWNNSNQTWYESKGYKCTNKNDFIEVKAKDLSLGSAKKIKVVCDYCGDEYETSYYNFIKGRDKFYKDACCHCASKKVSEMTLLKRASKNFAKAKEICDVNGYKLITDVSEYTNVKMNIKYICPEHGIKTTMLDNFIRGHICFKCSYNERFENIKVDKEYINDYISNTNDNLWMNPDEYTNSTDRCLKIKCKCGNIYTVSFANFLRHNINRCPTCSQKESYGELRIRNLLDEFNIEYIQEKRFEDCKDKRSLPFDFYLPSYNLCIEFDSRQHYMNIYGEKSFNNTIRHDKIKNEFCELNNIKLIRIPYTEWGNIENIVKKELQI